MLVEARSMCCIPEMLNSRNVNIFGTHTSTMTLAKGVAPELNLISAPGPGQPRLARHCCRSTDHIRLSQTSVCMRPTTRFPLVATIGFVGKGCNTRERTRRPPIARCHSDHIFVRARIPCTDKHNLRSRLSPYPRPPWQWQGPACQKKFSAVDWLH